MSRAAQWVGIVGGVVAVVFALNWLTQRTASADPQRVAAAQSWLRDQGRAWTLRSCERQAGSSDASTIQCTAETPRGDKTVYASFTADGAVADVCSSDDPACAGFSPPKP